jgi:DNA repair photolyase
MSKLPDTLPSYYSPRISSELPDCSSPLTFDTYSRCSMHCSYCFSHSQKDINPGTKEAPLQGVNPEKLLNMIDGELNTKEAKLFYKYFFKNKFLLHWGGLADSFCHYERKYGLSYEILKGLLEREYPLMFSSKGPAITDDKYIALFEKYAKQNTIAFQFSIVTADDKLAKKVEPGVPSPTERFEYMKVLSDMGYWCVLRLRPFIIGVTDETLPELLQKAYESGAKALSTEFYALDHRCVGSMRKATEKMGKLMGIDNIFSYFHSLSPKERGGYCRLNRLIKEPYVKYMYKFCIEHGMVFTCSDPDFKELSGSQNCCGLPPKGYHPTKTLNNWSSHQLTAYIMEARIAYHKTGERRLFKFNEVYGEPDWIFDDIRLSHQDIGCTKYPYAIRKQLTLKHIMQDKWNNLNSYSNPTAYFHGKIVPVGLDDAKENLVYKYNPSVYEEHWVEEGINLSFDWRDEHTKHHDITKWGSN